jgi:hypothetical protein
MKINWSFIFGALFVIGLLFGADYGSRPLQAATASVTYSFSAGQKIVASQVNQNFNDILGALNGNLNTDNILDGGIATADLGAASVTNPKIAPLAVATGNIAQYAVDYSKLASANVVQSIFSPFGTGQDQSGIIASATIVLTDDRPVLVFVTNTATSGSVVSDYGNSGASWEVQTGIRRDGATKSVVEAAGSSSLMPCSSYFSWIDRPGVGTHTYSLMNIIPGTTSQFRNCTLQLQEL